jgi:hypothetical protein
MMAVEDWDCGGADRGSAEVEVPERVAVAMAGRLQTAAKKAAYWEQGKAGAELLVLSKAVATAAHAPSTPQNRPRFLPQW